MALQNRRVTRGRHPLLKLGSLANRIFNSLKDKPDMTMIGIAELLMEARQTVNGMMQRMKAEGLIIQVPVQKGNRTVWGYRAVTENETSFRRDKVRVEVTFFVNDFGEYSAECRVIGQLPTANQDNPVPVHKADFYAAVPRPNEPLKTREIFDVPRQHTKNVQPLTIDTTYADITEEKDETA